MMSHHFACATAFIKERTTLGSVGSYVSYIGNVNTAEYSLKQNKDWLVVLGLTAI